VLSASANRQYQLLGAVLILVIVGVTRKLASMNGGKFSELVNSDIGGVILSLATSSAGAAYSLLKGGAHLNLSLVLSVITNSALASGIFTYGKHVNARAKTMRKAKPPAPPSEAPPEPPADIPPTPPMLTMLLPLLFISALLPGCTPAQTQAWKTAGIDALRCAGTGVLNAAGSALIDLMAALDSGNTSLDAATLGKSLAVKYGSDAAICALGKAAADLLPAVGLHAAPTARTKLLQGMLDTQKDWAK
jgi:hypothetical protein